MQLNYIEQGANDLEYAMKNLPASLRNNALRPALREGAQVVKVKAVQNLKRLIKGDRSTGLLERSVIVRTLRMKNRNLRVAVALAPQRTYATGARVGLVGSVFELGRQKGKGGVQKPNPWLRPAQRESRSEVYNVILRSAGRRLNLAIEKAKR